MRTTRAGTMLAVSILAVTLSPVPARADGEAVPIGDSASSKEVSVTRPTVLTAPPVLDDPLSIVIDAELSPRFVDDFDRVGCDGYIYELIIPYDRDARVTMDPEMGPLAYPVWITGGRDVHVIGLELRPAVQAGCDIGEAHQYRDRSRPNIHPRLVGGKAFRLQQRGATYLEGIDIDLAGQEADCFVSRNKRGMTLAEIERDRDIVIVNTRCTGIEGLDDSKVGDGIHGDFFQNQGKDDVGSLVLENVTYLTSANGVTLHRWNAKRYQPRLFHFRNVNFGWDLRYSADDRYEQFGLAFTGGAKVTRFENVWLDEGRGLNYGILNGQRIGAYAQSGYVIRHPEIGAGAPPTGDFAPSESTGLEYPRSVDVGGG